MMPRLAFAALIIVAFAASAPHAHAQKCDIKADGGSVGICGDAKGATINIGIPPEVLAALVKQNATASEAQQKLIAKLESELSLNQQQIRAALNILGEANIQPESLATKLVEVAGRFKALQETASSQPGDDPKVTALKSEAQQAVAAGELARADALLAEVEAEQSRTLDRLAVNAAETSAKRGDIAMTRLRYVDAARHFANAAALFPPNSANEDKRIGYLEQEADAYFLQGDERADKGAMQLALEHRRALLGLIDKAREPLRWGKVRHNIGNALLRIGERESDSRQLQAAVAAFSDALQERTRERAPLDWANTQNSLALALNILGEMNNNTAALELAIATYRAALEEWTRERAPLDWAMTQDNLGTALWALGIRTGDEQRLREAVAAAREALTVRTRERDPLDWAATQVNLATELSSLGMRTGDSRLLDEAVAAYREAQNVVTFERRPVNWAILQHDLGMVLMQQGELAGSVDKLEASVSAFRAALRVRTREAMPRYWAQTQQALDEALNLLQIARRNQSGAAPSQIHGPQ